ncbi:hypothetical protein N7456_002413 [Penicillium angulare]|uniref:Uncharacterized protein n=1 Tax=Penicillium angulare TaxID=116970 RepID=A0A9W9KNZ2_9EURO|nr:hypothetical protein N7456_002413 [Penicillium angulare]
MSKPKLSESPERQGIRETLKNIAIDAEQLGLDSFDPKQLAGLNVRLEHMDMNETSSSKPLYFAPYPDHQLPYAGDQLGGMEKEVGDDRWGREFDRHCYQLADVIQTNIDHSSYHFNEHNFPLAPWTSMEPGDYPYVAMDFGLEYRARYLTYEITDIDDTEHPHVKLIVRQGMDATDSTILRGELIPMVATMVVQSLRKRLLNHIVFPVLKLVPLRLLSLVT